ncbi:MarR family winged helix-turn-helix transcriptional regulator [Alkalilacustris brevis]|uniref:MarR family winged helix-turn-helix transcriptional regulator n=1 Tax=Alkalilacustris brevis TaxID=2026338 RepID=UPI000E0CD5F8|nr:MarR family transcriptional regulator [Alkalilacustris brevis]
MSEIFELPGHFIRRLHQISVQAFHARARAAGHDLTPVQFVALEAVRTTPGIDQASVAAMIAYDRTTIGGVIDRLVEKGYLKREISPRDRRARVLTLSAAGKRILDEFTPAVLALQADILCGLTEEERRTFLALARKATRALHPEEVASD